MSPRVFVVYADHDLGPNRGQVFNSFVKDLEDAGLVVYHRPNYRTVSGEQIMDAVADALGVCDCLVAFVGHHSTTVGFLIKDALALGLPVLCLYNETRKYPPITRSLTGPADRKVLTLKGYERQQDAVRLATDFAKASSQKKTKAE